MNRLKQVTLAFTKKLCDDVLIKLLKLLKK